MFYSKPKIRYVDMCKYIDDTIYNNAYDVDLIYEYLYHICAMLCRKRNYFETSSEVDDFCIFASHFYYNRLTNKKQFDDEYNLLPIKSILNYIKKTLYSVRGKFCEKYDHNKKTSKDREIILSDLDSFRVYTDSYINPMYDVEFASSIEDICSCIKHIINSTPYRDDKVMRDNLYISCMMSFLSSITLKNNDLKRIENFVRPSALNNMMLEELYMSERYGTTILYHLDDSMYNYVAVLTNKVRHMISKSLSECIHSYVESNIAIKNIIMQQCEGDNNEC